MKHTPAKLERDIIKALSCKRFVAAAGKIMQHSLMRATVYKAIGMDSRRQLKRITAATSSSMIMQSDPAAIRAFSWDELFTNMQSHSKHICEFLLLMLPRQKRERAKSMVSLIVAMLAKMTNQKAGLVQSVISLLLFAGHASSQVSVSSTLNAFVYILLHAWILPSLLHCIH